VAHTDECLVPERTGPRNLEDNTELDLEDEEMEADDMDRDTEDVLLNSEDPSLINQAELNYPVRDLILSKTKVELLASRL
jgi:hypothetical protein